MEDPPVRGLIFFPADMPAGKKKGSFVHLGIKRIAQAVADEIQREHRQADGGDGEEHLIGSAVELFDGGIGQCEMCIRDRPVSSSAIIKWAMPFNACGTYFLIAAISFSDRNKCVALTDFSHTCKSSRTKLSDLSWISRICIYPNTSPYISTT